MNYFRLNILYNKCNQFNILNKAQVNSILVDLTSIFKAFNNIS